MPRILVADDNTNIQRMVSLALEQRGIDVISVGNGEAAVRRLPDLNPDLILADIFMPVRNGYEVCEFVKKNAKYSHIPVILLVGAFDPLDEKEARRVGADGVLKKPFVPPDPLIAMVTSVLEKNPRIAAELAKAKQAAAEPPQPAIVEAPPKIELKPLPEFPEPSPDEAALAYGYANAKRVPPAENPDVSKDFEVSTAQEAQEDFDGASTTSDWRRSAMNLEVPEGAVQGAAFSVEENLEPVKFPLEQAKSAKRIRILDFADLDPTVEDLDPAEAEGPAPAAAEPQAAEGAAEPPAMEREITPEFHEIQEIKAQEKTEEGLPARGTHWMDLMADPSPEYPAGGWLSGLTPPAEEADKDKPAEHVASEVTLPVEEPSAETTLVTDLQAVIADEVVTAPGVQTMESVENTAEEEPFFADEIEDAETPVMAAVPEIEVSLESDGEPIPATLADFGSLIVAPPEKVGLFKEPGLVEPVAVRVTPEPLLVDDRQQSSPVYGARPEEVPPLHSFEVTAPEHFSIEEPGAEEPSVRAQSETPISHSSLESSGFEEHIPDSSSLNRETLCNIPFLAPPRDFGSKRGEPNAIEPAVVDAIVQRVLERIEPQIHQLLSQSLLKPLVEELLEAETEKRAR